MEIPETFVIHVSDDYLREKHVRAELKDKIRDYKFVNEGDISDLNQQILDEYFDESLHDMSKPNEISCTYKHLLVYKQMVEQQISECLVLEDDIVLYPIFNDELQLIREEIQRRRLSNFLISLEDSTNQFVPKSERVSGQLLYKKDRGRLTGAYLIDLPAAKNFLQFVRQHKCNRLIDNYQTYAANKGVFDIYWCLNAIATQGSKNGLLESHIAKPRSGMLRKIGARIHHIYKKLLYEFR